MFLNSHHTHTLKHTNPNTQIHTLKQTHSNTHTQIHTLKHTHSNTHTQTHTLSLTHKKETNIVLEGETFFDSRRLKSRSITSTARLSQAIRTNQLEISSRENNTHMMMITQYQGEANTILTENQKPKSKLESIFNYKTKN